MTVGKQTAQFIANCDKNDYDLVRVFLDFAITWLRNDIKFDVIFNQKYDQEKIEKAPLAKELLSHFADHIRDFDPHQQLSMVLGLEKDLEEVSKINAEAENLEKLDGFDYEVVVKFIDFAIGWLKEGYRYEVMFNQKYDREQREKSPVAKKILTDLGYKIGNMTAEGQLKAVLEFKEKVESQKAKE